MNLLGTHIELTYPLGARVIMTSAAYAALTVEQVAGTRARLLGRIEMIALRSKARFS